MFRTMFNENFEKFLCKANKTHNNKYDYSKVDYVNSVTKICIICPEHGEFWQSPASHLRGGGCPLCANKKRGRTRVDTETLIQRAEKVHGKRYNYSETIYRGANEKIRIICPEHGVFEQLPYAHLSGQGCPKCKHKELSNDELIDEFNKIHNHKYDYSLVRRGNLKRKVDIICPEHGIFKQTPSKHLSGQGCPLCANERRSLKMRMDVDEFVRRANKIHSNIFDYSRVSLNGQRNKIKIICPRHGEFEQFPFDHLNGHACPSCSVMSSKGEDCLYDFICSLVGADKVERRNRQILDGKEIDIFIPSYNIGFEYNGVVWHSEKYGKDSQYHLNKTETCLSKGIKLYQIFEDEYVDHKEIVENKIRHLLGKNGNVEHIGARNTSVVEIDPKTSKDFLSKYHIQGNGKASVYIGCYYGDCLVGVMTFKNYGCGVWELNRFATSSDYVCIGVGGKLFKFFVNNYNPIEVKTFADRRWTVDKNDNLYTKLGFKLDGIEPPDYMYTDNGGKFRKHKFNFRKQVLNKKYELPLTMTERVMCQQLGFYRVWNCGLFRYKWKKPVNIKSQV